MGIQNMRMCFTLDGVLGVWASLFFWWDMIDAAAADREEAVADDFEEKSELLWLERLDVELENWEGWKYEISNKEYNSLELCTGCSSEMQFS